ncbi:CoA transferase [Pseudooceanicola sp. LIPI14-2-Ac024]|uniref:CoA transferase n=1 Tax=Pseudooceanicola sp. LIPI14-2-Ac024 TaxID=3344875 RepID=UPI0035CF5340
MTNPFTRQIDEALGTDMTPEVALRHEGADSLPSYFDVAGLATASVGAAARELAALTGAGTVAVHQRRALIWFGASLRPEGWSLPDIWDPVAGDYATADGWIRLHTNAPHHRAAALSVLGCDATRDAVAETVRDWPGAALQDAVVAAGGCAAAMHDMAGWAAHPQGRAVAADPLIGWSVRGEGGGAATLQGLKVLDLTRVLAGPVATRFLAGFGADVLRIDPPGWNEPGVEMEVTLGKRLAGLDLKTDEGRATFEALLQGADVFVHGYRPGALAALGYGPDTLARLAPRAVEVTLDAYGWQGPWAGRRGFDSLVQMSSGIAAEGMRRAGAARPVPLPVQALDHATGYLMAAAVLRALRRRAATGEVMRARLSLARTAALLVSAGAGDLSAKLSPGTGDDLAPGIEETGWGAARRVAFPVTLNGALPVWRYPAHPLRRDPARW